MSEGARTFSQVRKQKTLEEFHSFAKMVTEQYGKTEYGYDQELCAKDNFLSIDALRKLIRYAIVENLVTLEMVYNVRNKAIVNQRVKRGSSTSVEYYRKLLLQRSEKISNGFSRAKIKEIAEDIAFKPSEKIRYFTIKYLIESDIVTMMILKRAIIENIVSDEVMELIIKRSLSNNPKERAKETFKKMRIKREEYKKENSQ